MPDYFVEIHKEGTDEPEEMSIEITEAELWKLVERKLTLVVQRVREHCVVNFRIEVSSPHGVTRTFTYPSNRWMQKVKNASYEKEESLVAAPWTNKDPRPRKEPTHIIVRIHNPEPSAPITAVVLPDGCVWVEIPLDDHAFLLVRSRDTWHEDMWWTPATNTEE